MRPLLFFEKARLDRGFVPGLDAVRIRALADADRLFQLGADEVQADGVVGGEPGREAVRDQPG